MTDVLGRKGWKHTESRMLYNKGGSDETDAAPSQRMPRTDSHISSKGEAGWEHPCKFLREPGPANTLGLDFEPPEP